MEWDLLERTNGWSFLTNHAHVLLVIQADPQVRQREIALRVGITEGAVQRIISELENSGYLRRHRVGRRNHYEVCLDLPLRHPLEQHHTIGDIVDVLSTGSNSSDEAHGAGLR
ncbi:MAG: winged helix-turn-helix domain-containing protein [Acidimicrobiales bacterium]|nr:winged helix-turn-helix domain-containing protein [Acidimicrobiales bacterium]